MIMILFMLSGKYDGVYSQFNKCLSLLISIILTKILLHKLIPILIPYLGLTIHIKAITFYLSVVCFYFFNKLIINVILFKYEPSKKNTIIQSKIGILLGLINGILITSFVISITFYTLSINNQILIKLNNSILFQYIYDINLILFNYAK